VNYLVWRQHRRQLQFAAAVLGVLLLVLIPSGVHAANAFSSASRACIGTGTCDSLGDVFANYGVLFDIIGLSATVPALMGLFWGAPLVAGEVERGTHQLAWTQSITRRHWLAGKLGWLLLAAALWGAAIGTLVSWWSRPENTLYQYRFDLGHFDTQGIVPVGYSVFAVALGAAVGSVLRRTLPAIATTLALFAGIRFGIDYGLRPHYLTPLRFAAPLGSSGNGLTGSFWTLSSDTLAPSGAQTSGLRLSLQTLPADCRNLVLTGQTAHGQVSRCLGTHGYTTVTTYQPASRFWSFQGIETGIYLVLAALLIGLTFALVTRRDA
jgi:hypothetical protein